MTQEKDRGGTNAAETREQRLEATLRMTRKRLWNRWYDLPGRDLADAVIEIDRALGQESSWLPRFAEKFPVEYEQLVEDGYVEA